jgi:hypothetical protein
MEPTTLRRIARTTLGAGLAVLAALAISAPASAARVGPRPSAFDFSDCPAIPAGLDRHAWRCEVHLATGDITVGDVTVRGLALRITHAEGPLPDGESGQVFGTLRSAITPVPGTRRDGLPSGLGVEVRYAGYADLIGNGPDPGGLYLMLAVHDTGLGPDCTIGSMSVPVRTHAVRVGDTYTTPTDPPIRMFTMQDTAFAVPPATGCRGLVHRVDGRFGLPSPSGNALTLHAAYTYRAYDALGG